MSAPKIIAPPLKNVNLERAVLSSLINNRQGADYLLQHLNENYFYERTHLAIYEAVRDIYKAGKEVSMLSVNDEMLRRHGQTWDGQLMAYLADVALTDEEPMSIDRQLAVLNEYAIRRALFPISQMLEALSSSLQSDLHEGIKTVTDGICRAMGQDLGQQFVGIRELIAEAQQHIQDNLNPETQHLGILTGIGQLDEVGGLPLGGLTVVAAKPSHGKTSLGIYLAMQAMTAGQRVAYYSTEMTGLEITQRFLSVRSRVKSNAIARMPLDAQQQYKVGEAAAYLTDINTPQDLMFFDRHMSCDYAKIIQSIRALSQQQDIKLFVIDYIQMLSFGSDNMTNDRRAQQINAAAQEFKRMARDLGVSIVLLSQLNRDFVGLPSVANIKEGGGINEASDLTLLLYCAAAERDMDAYPAPYQNVPVKDTLLILQDKGRGLGTNHFVLGFERELTRVYNLPKNVMSTNWVQQKFDF